MHSHLFFYIKSKYGCSLFLQPHNFPLFRFQRRSFAQFLSLISGKLCFEQGNLFLIRFFSAGFTVPIDMQFPLAYIRRLSAWEQASTISSFIFLRQLHEPDGMKESPAERTAPAARQRSPAFFRLFIWLGLMYIIWAMSAVFCIST